MYGEEIKNVIIEYLKSPKAEYAIMIDGEWGSGKTYFLTHSLLKIMEMADLGKSKRRKYAYVSLYGVKSIDEISREILFQYFGDKNKKIDAVITTASNMLTASLGAINIDLSELKKSLTKIDINNWIICFDDLERCCLPVNEILGYINHLVEHNKCKVIVLANEKEIGKALFNQNLADKYQVVLSGRKLRLSSDENLKNGNLNQKSSDEAINDEKLKKHAEFLFGEDILYKSIREKVIGLTIRYDPEMDTTYDLIADCYSNNNDFRAYLANKKEIILKYFEDEKCCNLRTLISVLNSTEKVYTEMWKHGYNTSKYYENIMRIFLEYVVLFTIYFKNGGNVSELKLTSEIGQIFLRQNAYRQTRGFKFLERYCTTLSFREQEFEHVVSMLKKEYEEEEGRIARLKSGSAYGKLSSWREEDDEEVKATIALLQQEIHEDKYSFNSYQSIIGQLMVLKAYGYDIGNMDELINAMNRNIENSEEAVDVARHSFSFENNPDLRAKYDEYVDRLKLKADGKNRSMKADELLQSIKSDKWAENLLDYCNEHVDEFFIRNGFADLVDMEFLSKRVKEASPKEIYIVKDVFKRIYNSSNINEFFMNDRERINEFRKSVEQMELEGINKNLAKKDLIACLDDIIERLKEY